VVVVVATQQTVLHPTTVRLVVLVAAVRLVVQVGLEHHRKASQVATATAQTLVVVAVVLGRQEGQTVWAQAVTAYRHPSRVRRRLVAVAGQAGRT
jgi:hypothetical protein